MMKKGSVLKAACAAALAIVAAGGVFAGGASEQKGPGDAKEGWVPAKPIEMVVASGAGGGNDLFARTVVKMIQDNKLCPQPIVVMNKPGGSSSIGYAYLSSKKGDPYTISTINSSFYTTPLVGGSPVSIKDFEFITNMCDDALALVVGSKSPYMTLADLFAAIKAAPGKINGGGTSNISYDAIACYMINDKAGGISYVPFSGGGEMMTAVLGGHIDFAMANPVECQEQVTAGNLRMLAVSSKNKLGRFPDVKTFKEQGIDIVMVQSRGFITSKGMPTEAMAYYEGLFKKVYDLPEFQKYMAEESQVGNYLNHADNEAFAVETNEKYKTYLAGIKSK